MKKNAKLVWILAVLLTLAMVLGACGSSQEDVAGNITPVEKETTAGAEETTAPVEETTEPAEETAAPTEEAASQENTVSMGRIEGGTYTNAYMGFAIDLDESWQYYTAEELQELPDNVEEMLKDTEIGDAMEGVTQFTDMMAESVEELATMNVLYQKLDMATRLIYQAMDDEAIVDATLAQADLIMASYSQMGIEASAMEKVTVNFLGEECLAIKTTATMQGTDYYILQVFDYHLGQYSVTITFSSFVEDKTEALAAMCYPIGE